MSQPQSCLCWILCHIHLYQHKDNFFLSSSNLLNLGLIKLENITPEQPFCCNLLTISSIDSSSFPVVLAFKVASETVASSFSSPRPLLVGARRGWKVKSAVPFSLISFEIDETCCLLMKIVRHDGHVTILWCCSNDKVVQRTRIILLLHQLIDRIPPPSHFRAFITLA
jgi:hypothetical protein